jgi:hypothetical protein
MADQRFPRWTRRERDVVRGPKLEICDDNEYCRDEESAEDVKQLGAH